MYQQPEPYRYDQQPDPYGYAPPQPQPRHGRRIAVAAGAATVVASAAVAAMVYASTGGNVVSGTGTAALPIPAVDRQGNSDNSGTDVPDPSAIASGTATAAQQVGVVDINTELGYQRAAAAGTGMVLTSSGEILTNNHVIAGATSISVQVVTTGKTYSATVVGTSPTQDVAVLQLQNASGLQTAKIGSSAALQVGATVTGVGNAGGRGGIPSAAAGSIVALDQSLTATDESGQNPERLTGMIEVDAPIEAGDSGGPLYDSADRVIGMDTAASTSQRGTSVAFAIPIDRATSIADEIEAGHASATIHLGYPGFLGISAGASPGTSGALVESVVDNGPAAQAGIEPGDLITAVAGNAIPSATALHTALAASDPGQNVDVTWLSSDGQSHHASITLAKGPAD
jgi:S1-C subfamily serine protease